MVSYTANEGTLFTDRSITNDSALDAYVQQLFPYLPAESLDHLLNRLYPPANSSFHGYKEVQARLSLLEGEAFISCNAYYLSHALNKRTWAYVFDIEPALHGQDIAYIFFTDATPNVQNGTLAEGMQEYLMQFVGAGNPNNGSTMLPVIPVYGQSRQLLVMENSGFKVREENEERQERCRWWQKTL
jgi:carboxylesterase type B